jgi:cytochrome c556
MAGAINRSSNTIFGIAVSADRPTDEEWVRVGEAAIILTGAATLISIPGTGPRDAEWVANPRWRVLSSEMQAAAMAVGSASSRNDRNALTEATARLAQSCQSCHLEFSGRLVTSGSQAEPATTATDR